MRRKTPKKQSPHRHPLLRRFLLSMLHFTIVLAVLSAKALIFIVKWIPKQVIFVLKNIYLFVKDEYQIYLQEKKQFRTIYDSYWYQELNRRK